MLVQIRLIVLSQLDLLQLVVKYDSFAIIHFRLCSKLTRKLLGFPLGLLLPSLLLWLGSQLLYLCTRNSHLVITANFGSRFHKPPKLRAYLCIQPNILMVMLSTSNRAKIICCTLKKIKCFQFCRCCVEPSSR
jgi:hypothetical protein